MIDVGEIKKSERLIIFIVLVGVLVLILILEAFALHRVISILESENLGNPYGLIALTTVLTSLLVSSHMFIGAILGFANSSVTIVDDTD